MLASSLSRLCLLSLAKSPVFGVPPAAIFGGGALAGVVYSGISHSSTGGPKISGGFSPVVSFFSPSSNPSAEATPIDLFSGISPTFSSIGSFCQTVFGYLSSSVTSIVQFFTQGNSNYSTMKTGFEGLKTSTFESSQFKELFKNIHKKVPNIVKFFIDKPQRDRFVKLFSGDQATKHLEAFKVLSGAKPEVNKYFKVDKGVLTHLVNKFAENPTKVFKRMERLTKLIGEISQKYATTQGQEGPVGGSGSEPSKPYDFDIPKLEKFLQDRSDGAQVIYELGMKAEVGLNSVEIPLPPGTSTVTSIFSSLFGVMLGNKSSSA